MASNSRIPVLDGIRGLAVVSVMAFHFCLHGGLSESPAWIDQQFLRVAGSGWIGVDLFFVMSGFLITGILWDSREREGYFRVFYTRRFLRIFPLYYAYLAVRMLVLPHFFPELAITPGRRWMFWTYTSNAAPILSHLTALDASRPAGLYHFWSLAVEEQFYFVWPFIVWRFNRSQLMKLCAGLVIMTPLVRLALSLAFEPEAGFVFSAARLDALAIGAFCALAARGDELARLRRYVRPALIASGLAIGLVFLSRGKLNSADLVMQAIGYSAVAFFAVALLVRSLEVPGLFGWQKLQWMGGLCYGLYVFNGPLGYLLGRLLPVMAFPAVLGSHLPAQLVVLVIGFAANIAVAWLAWHGFEKHFNALKYRTGYGRITVPAPVYVEN